MFDYLFNTQMIVVFLINFIVSSAWKTYSSVSHLLFSIDFIYKISIDFVNVKVS